MTRSGLTRFGAAILMFCLSLTACSDDSSLIEEIAPTQTEVIRDLPVDFQMPLTLWKMLLGDDFNFRVPEKAAPAAASADQDAKKDEAAPPPAPRSVDEKAIIFSAIEVLLEEKTRGVLKSPRIQISFPRGGGTLDLSQYVTDQVGTFFIRFLPTSAEKKVSEKTYFWSRAKKRRIDDEIYGTGCNKVLELGPEWTKMQSGEGFKVNTHRQRHASVLGGRFVFTVRTEKELFLSQVLVTDSVLRDFFCEDIVRR